ncbi:MAG: class I SAM-dependent methyltransferase [Pseudomonadales bacterium]|nr:class I SAM-dependent methyltransferase [Pseudomonadales bacterium]
MRNLEHALSVCAENIGDAIASSDCRRLFHGRGHTYPDLEFLTIDWYPPYIIVGIFGDKAGEEWVLELARGLEKILPDMKALAVQYRGGRKTACIDVIGCVPETHIIQEAGLKFILQPKRNQNIGFFLDMAPAREWVRKNSRGRNVLNLFAYTCSFSVFAHAGGAKKIINNDMSKPILQRGRDNHELNHQSLDSVKFIPHNLFKSWGKVRQFGRYDLIIIDPPTNQRGSFVAEKDYGTVLKRISQIANPGAKIVACLNSPFLPSRFISDQMTRRVPECKFVENIPAAHSFPEQFPDQGLKISVFDYPA